MAVLFAACGQKIENVKFINAKYGVSIESRIYPSTLNAIELEQVYKKWNIGIGKQIELLNVSFDIVLENDEVAPANMYITLNKLDDQEIFALTGSCHAVFDNGRARMSINVNGGVSFDGASDQLQLVFFEGDGENSSIKFKIENLSLRSA